MKASTVSVAEAARMLGVRLDYVYRLLWDATLDGYKSEGVWCLTRKSVAGYQKKRQRTRQAPREAGANAGAGT